MKRRFRRGTSPIAVEAVVAILGELVAVEELEVPDEAQEAHDGSPPTSEDLLDLLLALGISAPTACPR